MPVRPNTIKDVMSRDLVIAAVILAIFMFFTRDCRPFEGHESSSFTPIADEIRDAKENT